MFLILGDPIRWNQPVRLRHMTTRLYLRNSTEDGISLTSDTTDPLTEFRLVSLALVSYSKTKGKRIKEQRNNKGNHIEPGSRINLTCHEKLDI